MKVILEREKCIGCGSCQAICPKYWQMAGDGKTTLLNSKKKEGDDEKYELQIKEVECNQKAADACPAQCIHVEK